MPEPQQGEAKISGEGGVRADSYVLRTLRQDGLAFGVLLLLFGGVIAAIPCCFVRGVGGNVMAAGIVVVLFVATEKMLPKIRALPSPTLHRILTLLGLEEH
jgi:hypothetical protein